MAEPRDTIAAGGGSTTPLHRSATPGAVFTALADNVPLYFGDEGDASIKWNGAALVVSGALSFVNLDAVTFATLKLDDDVAFTFGTGNDATIQYDEDGTDTLQFSGARVQFDAGAKAIDDKTLIFGTGDDASIEYDEDGTDELRFAGAAAIFENHVKIDDDKALRFGRDADVLLSYDEAGTDLLLVTGKGVRFGSLRRQLVPLNDDAALSDAQCNFSLITASVTGKTITLPALAAANAGADLMIAPIGNISAIVVIAGGAKFGDGTAAVDTLTLSQGQGAHIFNNGTHWFVVSPGTLS